MSKSGRFSAAFGSIVLNVALAVLMSREAGAQVPAADSSPAAPHLMVISTPGMDMNESHAGCLVRFRNRAIVAVVLALVV